MPKVISRGTTVASGTETQFTDEKLFVYYCVCGALCLTIDKPLETLPRRKTDNAHIIQAQKCEFRLKTKPLEPIIIKRDKGYEKQYRAGCVQCELPISYTPQEKGSPMTYILSGALRLQQYGPSTDPLPLEEIKELPGVEFEDYVAEARKEKIRAENEEEATARPALRLSDLPRQEQERQIREKLKALERGDDDTPSRPRPTASSARTSSSSSSSSGTTVAVPAPPTSDVGEKRSRESASRSRSSSRDSDRDYRRRERSTSRERDRRRERSRRSRSRSPEEKRRRVSRSRSRSRDRDRDHRRRDRSTSRERGRRDRY